MIVLLKGECSLRYFARPVSFTLFARVNKRMVWSAVDTLTCKAPLCVQKRFCKQSFVQTNVGPVVPKLCKGWLSSKNVFRPTLFLHAKQSFASTTFASTTFGKESQLYSVDQIRQNDTPWKSQLQLYTADRSQRRNSFFKSRLQERQKIRLLYGSLSAKVLQRYLRLSERPEQLIIFLESRLDVVCRRSFFFQSIASARQSIVNGGIAVNRKQVRSPGYQCLPGDLIQVIQYTRSTPNTFQASQSALVDAFLQPTSNLLSTIIERKQIYRSFLNSESDTNSALKQLFFYQQILRLLQKSCTRLSCSARESSKVCSFFTSTQNRKASLTIPLHAKTFLQTKERNTIRKAEVRKHCIPLLPNKNKTRDTESCESRHKKSKIDFVTHLRNCTKSQDKENRVEIPLIDLDTKKKKIEYAYSLPENTVFSRPMHLQISYRSLSSIFLYAPQKVCVDITIDFELLYLRGA